jgi:lipid A 3-O-deacylase
MYKPRCSSKLIIALAYIVVTNVTLADEFAVSFGGGPQYGSGGSGGNSGQINSTFGVDYMFYRNDRSLRSSFHVGVGYTYIGADSDEFDKIQAISIYPQLSLYPGPDSKASSWFSGTTKPYFYVRALGPTFISANRLGTRQQANHFTFQAQIGIGLITQMNNGTEFVTALSFKHFSNANLFKENDGIDLPFVLNFGMRF